jgi:ATP-binding cassette subfamily C (CFTR/MRP) protein 1
MWPLPPSDSAEALNARLKASWQQQLSYVAAGQKKTPSLKIALFKAFGGPFVVAGCLKATYDMLSFLQPQLLRLLLSFVQSYATTDKKEHSQPQPAIQGFVIAFGMFACANLATFLLHQYFERAFESTMRVRSALAMLIYQKSLVLSNGEKGGRTTGDIVNLQSVDTVRIADLLTYLHIAWSGPFQVSSIRCHRKSRHHNLTIMLDSQIIIAFVSLYNLLGWQAFVGVGIMVVSLPVNAMIARRQKRLQKEQMRNKDKRTRLMNEVLSNIKSIKLYGWESAFSAKVLDVRNNQELTMLKKIGYNNSMSFFFWSSTPFLVALGTFATYALTSPHPLTSDKIFPAISLFGLLAFPLGVFSNIISSIIEATVSVTRLESYLVAKELQKDARTIIRPDASNGYDTPRRGQEVVKIENGEFGWSDEQGAQPTLQQIDLTVNKGELVAVLGRVGDGKTSLLSCIRESAFSTPAVPCQADYLVGRCALSGRDEANRRVCYRSRGHSVFQPGEACCLSRSKKQN